MEHLVWLIPALPLAGVVLLVLFGTRLGDPIAGWLATFFVTASFVVSVVVFFMLRGQPEHTFTQSLFAWIPVGDFRVDIGFLLDPLSMVMILFITGVSALIHLYSIGYMHGDSRFPRFFLYLNLFVFAMLVLVLGENLLMTYLGWEGVGTCSYLLISFWFESPANASAGKKSFVTNRIGDWGFIVATFATFFAFGSVTYSHFLPLAPGIAKATATFIVLMLLVGAVSKSAQIPLYIWLPDAMAGPTPVSALIHAATMVTAGVYLLCRINPLIAASYDWVPTLIAWIGVLSALIAAFIATSQMDIKKVLAFSTISQLGYMFLAVGVRAYWAAIFHMITHAFFKACLFLGSGSVIHSMRDEQDMRRMGALRKFMPITAVSFIVATLAISGVPPFSGFWSKDEILTYALRENVGLYLVGLFTALLTAYYMGRLTYRTFYGDAKWPAIAELATTPAADPADPVVDPVDPADPALDPVDPADAANGADTVPVDDPAVLALAAVGVADAALPADPEPQHAEHLEAGFEPHESPATMTIPLIVLGFLATIAGLLNLPIHGWTFLEDWLEPVFVLGDPAPTPYRGWTLVLLLAISASAAVVGLFLPYLLWSRRSSLVRRVQPLVFVRGFYYDHLVTWFMGHPGREGFRATAMFDSEVIDGAVNGVGRFSRWSGSKIRYLQSGLVRAYALMIAIGAVVMVAYVLSTVTGWRP